MDQTKHRNRVAIIRTVVVYQSKQLLLSDPALVLTCQFFASMMILIPRTVAVCQSKLFQMTRLILCFMNSGCMPVQVIPMHGTVCWSPLSGFPPLSYLKRVFPLNKGMSVLVKHEYMGFSPSSNKIVSIAQTRY